MFYVRQLGLQHTYNQADGRRQKKNRRNTKHVRTQTTEEHIAMKNRLVTEMKPLLNILQ